MSYVPSEFVVKRYVYHERLAKVGNLLIFDQENSQYTNQHEFDKWTMNQTAIIEYAATLDVTMSHLCNLYVNSFGTYSDGEFYFHLPFSICKRESIYIRTDGPVTCRHEHVIALGHQCVGIYGHFFLDVLSPMFLFPDEIIKKSKIICTNQDFVFEYMAALGIKIRQMLVLHGWCFAKNLYVSEKPRPHDAHTGIAYIELSRRLRKAFNITKTNESIYALSNRNPKSRRTLTQDCFNLIVSEIRRMHPERTWTVVPDSFPTQKEAAIEYSKMKYLLAPTGSGLLRTLYMEPGTIVLSLQVNFNDFALEGLGVALGINFIAYQIGKQCHYFTRTYDFPVEKLWPAFNYSYKLLLQIESKTQETF